MRSAWLRAAAVVALGLSSGLATTTTAAAPPAAPATPALRLVNVAPDRDEIHRGNERLGEVKLATPVRSRGTVRLREVATAGPSSRRLLELRVPITGKQAAGSTGQSEVWVGIIEAGRLQPIHSGLVGPRDPDGEVTRELSVGPEGLAIWESAARLARCDGRPARLGLRRFDLSTGKLGEPEPDLPPLAPTVLSAKRGGKPPAARPRVAFSFSSTNAPPFGASSAGTESLVAPSPINDGDPRTVWLEGAAGDGVGEVLTARSSASGQAVVGLRLTPGDTRSRRDYRAHARARALHLSLGPAAEQQFEVRLEEGGDGYRRPLWLSLPRPVPASCVTITVREVVRGADQREGDVAAWGDIEVFSDLDSEAGPARLVKSLGEVGCEARVADVVSLGASALPALVELINATAPEGRDCGLEALRGIPLPRGRSSALAALRAALPTWLAEAPPAQEKPLVALLATLDEPPVAALVEQIGDDERPVEIRVRLARALAGLPENRGQSALLAAAGHGPAPLRATIRELLARSSAAIGEQALGILEGALPSLTASQPDSKGAGAGEAEIARLADLAEVLGQLASAQPPLRQRATAVLTTLASAASGPFEPRARAIRGLGLLDEDAGIAALAKVRGSAEDPVLRLLATRALAASNRPAALPALRSALADVDPAVRETAVVALGRRGDKQATAQIIAAAKQEPWPLVRRAEVTALGELCGEGTGDLLERAVERDLDDVRRAALSGLVVCRDGRAPRLLLQVLGREQETAGLRSYAAVMLGRLRDPATAPAMADALERLAEESRNDLGLEAAAVATLRALGAIGGPAAADAAHELRRDPRPSLRRSAVEALARVCDGKAAAALREATRDQDQAVATAAAAGLRRCGVAAAPPDRKEIGQ